MSPYGGIAPTNCSLVPGAAQQGGSDADSPNSVIYRGDGMAGRPTFGNALDAINDIDWVCDILSHCTTLTDYYAE
jgi:hypothetical protein